MNTLEKLSEELLDAVMNGKGGAAAKATELSNCLSARISEAINPIDHVTAPFAILILRQYAEEISRRYPGIQHVAEALKCISQIEVFVIPKNRGENDGPERIR